MKNQIKVGIVGCGYWGPNLIRNFRQTPKCKVKLMCDLNQERLDHMRSLYPEITATKDFNKLLEGNNVDAIVIATSVRLHYSMAKASILAGKHTYVEKPMATSSAECEELISLARKKGVTLMVGHTYLYSSAVRKISEIIKAGDIGKILYINSRRLNLGLFQKDINVAWDLAPHDIAIILHLLGESPTQVNCQGDAHVSKGVEDVTNMSLSFPSKCFATIQNSWLEPRKVREMTIVGTRRMIVYDDVAAHEKIRIHDARVETPPHYDTFADFHYAYHYGDSYIPHIKQEEPVKTQCQHFIDCINSGEEPLTGGQQGLEMVRILEGASASLKQNGSAVQLNTHQGFQMPARLKARTLVANHSRV